MKAKKPIWKRIRFPVPKKASRPMSSKKGAKGYDRKRDKKVNK